MTTKKPLSKLERVSLREAWKHEASDLPPWLAETDNLNALADSAQLSFNGYQNYGTHVSSPSRFRQ
jgi:hypothetical protein